MVVRVGPTDDCERRKGELRRALAVPRNDFLESESVLAMLPVNLVKASLMMGIQTKHWTHATHTCLACDKPSAYRDGKH